MYTFCIGVCIHPGQAVNSTFCEVLGILASLIRQSDSLGMPQILSRSALPTA